LLAETQVGGDGMRVDLGAKQLGELVESLFSFLPSIRPVSPSMRFSSTVKAGTRVECWCTTPMP
jgi:hypothetical protein